MWILRIEVSFTDPAMYMGPFSTADEAEQFALDHTSNDEHWETLYVMSPSEVGEGPY